MKKTILVTALSVTLLVVAVIGTYLMTKGFLMASNVVDVETNQRGAMYVLRMINEEEHQYFLAHDRYADASTLRTLDSFRNVDARLNGYHFIADITVSSDGARYEVRLSPATPSAGRLFFYGSNAGLIRYKVDSAAGPGDVVCCSQ